MRAIPQLVSAALNPIPVYSLPNFLTMVHRCARASRAREFCYKTLDCLQELLIASEPQGMYLGNRY